MAVNILLLRKLCAGVVGQLMVLIGVLALVAMAEATVAAQPAKTESAADGAPPASAAVPAATPSAGVPASNPSAANQPLKGAAAAGTNAAGSSSPAGSDAADESTKLVQLDFQDQKWLPVLQWVAEQRHLNLDWQQLPEGTLNLTSARQYTIDEAEDLINMQLLARGFTLLQFGEVLRVVPLKNVDVTLVPRVTPEELATLQPHRFVRVTFPLTWMLADEAASEFKPLISPYGQLLPMASSNRLETMDAVANLREMYRVLTRAEGDETRRERVAEFRLKHRKAEEVAIKVRQLLGLPPETSQPTADTQTQLDIETTKFRNEAVKQLGAGAQPLLKDKSEVHLVVNVEENSILINGRPDKIEIVRQAIEAMDKPEPPRESSWDTFNRVKVYPLSGIDPQAITQLMASIQRAGNIDKATKIQYDASYNRLVVFGAPEDQVTVGGIIDSFRTEGRHAEVLALEQLDAAYATKAIKLVLKNPERPSATPGAISDGRFQIESDPSHNRLLLWATPAEVKEVRTFLEGLGETFAAGSGAPKMHIVSLRGAKSAVVAERLKTIWKELSDAPLIIESGQGQSAPTMTPAPPATTTPPAVKPMLEPSAGTPPQPAPMGDRMAAVIAKVRLASQQHEAATDEGHPNDASPSPPAQSFEPPAEKGTQPVRVLADKDDEMIIVSRDPNAAEVAKNFVEQIVPGGDVEVITLKYAQAAMIKMQIEQMLAHTRTGDASVLNSDPPLVIEADSRTNRLMIQHASSRQMELIKEIVPLLDQPEQGDERLARKQQIYHAQKKRASEIASVVKDVFRDLLSTSDKIFDARTGTRPFGYNQAMAATSKSPEYAGLLSVGVDESGNSLVISAPGYLIDEVMQVVKLVDTNASSEKIAVVPVSRAARANVGEALNRLLKSK